jgi:protein-tyrosine-phosphatase
MTMRTTLPSMSQYSWFRYIISATLFLATTFTVTLAGADPRSDQPATIVFVCLHGSVKSQMATAHFNRIAKERGLPFVALSRGIVVDKAIPASIRQGLAADGLVPAHEIPRGLTSEEASDAMRVFAFDDVPSDRKGATEVTYWSDVPLATKDYNAARDAIVRHIEDVVTSLTKK